MFYASVSQTFLCCGPQPRAPRRRDPLYLNFLLRNLTWEGRKYNVSIAGVFWFYFHSGHLFSYKFEALFYTEFFLFVHNSILKPAKMQPEKEKACQDCFSAFCSKSKHSWRFP